MPDPSVLPVTDDKRTIEIIRESREINTFVISCFRIMPQGMKDGIRRGTLCKLAGTAITTVRMKIIIHPVDGKTD